MFILLRTRQRASTELKNQDAKPSRKSVTAKGADLTGGKGAGTFDAADGVANDSPHESATKKSSAFVIDFNGSSKEDDTMPSRKPPMRKTFSDVRPFFFFVFYLNRSVEIYNRLI